MYEADEAVLLPTLYGNYFTEVQSRISCYPFLEPIREKEIPGKWWLLSRLHAYSCKTFWSVLFHKNCDLATEKGVFLQAVPYNISKLAPKRRWKMLHMIWVTILLDRPKNWLLAFKIHPGSMPSLTSPHYQVRLIHHYCSLYSCSLSRLEASLSSSKVKRGKISASSDASILHQHSVLNALPHCPYRSNSVQQWFEHMSWWRSSAA